MEWEFGLVDANQKEKERSDCLTKLIILPQTSMHICVCVCVWIDLIKTTQNWLITKYCLYLLFNESYML